MKSSKLRTFVMTVFVAVIISAGFGLVQRATSESLNVTFAPHPAFAMAGSTSVADIAERVLPSVVNIASTRAVRSRRIPLDNPFFRGFGRGRPQAPQMQRGLGSGVIISDDGIVITNNHVVAKADTIRVMLYNKREYDAKVIGTDPKSDVAVLRLKGAKGLRPLKLGNSDHLRLGDVVLAVGNPFGVGQTVTMGIVSAKGRANMGIVDYEDFIQTDAAINPGNSGGALVNMRGELIGINTAILSRSGGYQGIGFAIPTNMVEPIAKSLLKTGKVRRGWLGVAIQEVDPALARAMKLPTSRGVLISDIDPRGPAVGAGLKRGDLVVKINGKTVNSTAKLRNVIAGAGLGGSVTLDVLRDGKPLQLRIKLAELPARLGGIAAAPTGRTGGMMVAPLTKSTRNHFRIPDGLRAGVVIQQVEPGSAPARAGLQPGDVILEVNRVRIASVSRFNKLFSASRGQVLLLVYRAGYSQYILMQK